MFRQLDFRSWLTFLSRNRLYTAVNFIGLALALAFVLLVADYTARQLTVDNYQTKADRIYAVCSEESVASGYYLQKHLRDRYPEIESTCAVAFFEDADAGSTPVEIGRQKFLASVLYADTTFFRMFDFTLLEGSREEALAARENVVLSESFARKVFGTFNPLGQTLRVDNDERVYVVSGVMRDIERSTIPAADIVMRAERITENNAANDERMSNSGAGVTFLLERQGAELQAKVSDMLAFFQEIYWPYQGNVFQQVRLVPLRELYFEPVNNSYKLAHGSRSFLYILLGVGLVVLVFAVMNYINLTVAQAGFRAREMAARRLLGASRGNIFLKWMLESTLFCAAALLIASCIAELFVPWASQLLGTKVAVWSDISWSVAGWCLLAVVVLGVVSGLVPALLVARYQPIDIVRGTFRRHAKTVYGRVLIALQNVITIALLAASIAIGLQIRHLVNAPLGYETRDILNIEIEIFPDRSAMRRFCDALHSLPEVEAVGLGCGTPHDRGNNNTFQYGADRMVSFQVFIGDSTYFRMLGLERLRDNHVAVAAGSAASRDFWSSNVWYINQYALRELGIAEDAPDFKLGNDLSCPVVIAGIYRDFQIGTALDAPTGALLRVVKDSDGFQPWNIIPADNRRRLFLGPLPDRRDCRRLRGAAAPAAHHRPVHPRGVAHLLAGTLRHGGLLHPAETAGDCRTPRLRGLAPRDAHASGAQLHGARGRGLCHRRAARRLGTPALAGGVQRAHRPLAVDFPRRRALCGRCSAAFGRMAEPPRRRCRPRRIAQELIEPVCHENSPP